MSGKIIIGVTGEIGAGKTTFVKELKKFDVYPIYSDETAHKILKLNEVKRSLKYYFGKDIFENYSVNLKRLSLKAFQNKENWQKLIYSTHPYILKEIFRTIEGCKKKYIAIDAPLLFESGLDEYCSYIILVKAPKYIRKNRVKRMNWQEAEKRSSYLIPLKLKEKLADFLINNNQNRRRLRENAKKIWFRIKGKRS